MKSKTRRILLALLTCIPAGQCLAQVNLGSNGSYGPLNVTASTTLQVPPDGIFHCTTITFSPGATLRFTKNAANTPVYLLATGDITFNGGGSIAINVSGGDSNGVAGGIGGPGGFDGGQGGDQPGDGQGPGGGGWGWTGPTGPWAAKPPELPYRGSAGFSNRPTHAQQTTTAGAKYGNSLLIPIIGGSGGGGGKTDLLQSSFGGGGGGGAVVVASNTKISFAIPYTAISAEGGSPTSTGQSPQFGGGSGGAVRIVAPEITGGLDVRLTSASGGPDNAGMGRLRVDAINRGSFQVVGNDGISAQYASYGSNMIVFPPNFPVLRVKQVGTEVIAANRVDPVFVLFPAGSPEAQTLTVTVKDFNTTVPLRAVVTPQNGSRQTFDFTVDNSGGGSTDASVQVNIPAGTASRVDVWTR